MVQKTPPWGLGKALQLIQILITKGSQCSLKGERPPPGLIS